MNEPLNLYFYSGSIFYGNDRLGHMDGVVAAREPDSARAKVREDATKTVLEQNSNFSEENVFVNIEIFNYLHKEGA